MLKLYILTIIEAIKDWLNREEEFEVEDVIIQ